MNLGTRYLGLDLRNPVIAGSCGLTETVEGVRRCADAGAGAVVLKSIFEEQIEADAKAGPDATASSTWYSEAADYLARYGRENAVGDYLRLVREAKQAVSIPVIASIHCVSAGTWTEFARRAEEAGADALELNVFVLPSDPRRNAKANEKVYFDIARAVRRGVSIPVSLKIGSYLSGLAQFAVELSRVVDGLVLFNRYYRVDFDIENFELVPGGLLSNPEEILVPLRWISILSDRVACDLAATTGVHDGAGVVKQILAGAAAVQVCSTLYRNDVGHIGRILEETGDWMKRHGFSSVADFRGRMSQRKSENPAAFERVQFIRNTTT